MTETKAPQTGEKSLVVRRGRVDSVDLYEIKENELDLLENGSPASTQLNFAVFLLSISFSAVVALLTTTVTYKVTETIFVVVAVSGFLMGIYLLASWWRTRASVAGVVQRIRQRLPTDFAGSVVDVDASVQKDSTKNAPSG